MSTLLLKDLRLNCLPIVVAITLMIAPYGTAAVVVYQVYAPDVPSIPVVADYLATAAVFGLMLSIVAAGMLAGNIVACERADGSAVFLAVQPVSRRQILTSKALVVFTVISALWLLHAAMLFGLAPSLAADAKSYARIDNPPLFAGSLVILATGISWLASILGRSPSLAISAGLASTFVIPWTVYLLSSLITIAPDDLATAGTITQGIVGLGGLFGGAAIYLHRVEP